MGMSDMVEAVFCAEGVLARADPQYRVRDGQLQMAVAVAQTMENGGVLVVEAGTGVGKTYAYLVPSLLSGERVLLSTATKALQDQLFARDLPALLQLLGVPVRMALLKGRASYLCLHRMAIARQAVGANEPAIARVLARVEVWAQSTRAGDLAELPQLDERSPVIPLITSTRENCLGTGCPRFQDCHVYQARREALAADVVVINHHLFFADLAVRESGMAQLLPSVRTVIFDEAHQINETGVQFLGAQLSSRQWLDLSRDLLAAGLQHARGLVDWTTLASRLEAAERSLQHVVQKWPAGTRLRWLAPCPDGVDGDAWAQALAQLGLALAQVQEGLEAVQDTAPDFGRLYERVQQLLARLSRFAAAGATDSVRWVDVGLQIRMVESPLDIAQAMSQRILSAPSDAVDDDGWPLPSQAAPNRAWIFTSATLGDDERLSWFTERAGIVNAQILRVASPFDYANHAALYVPRSLPSPADPAHSSALALWVAEAADQLRGRTLVLTTTLKALRTVGEALKARFNRGGRLDVLVQGEAPKRLLMERFRAGDAAGGHGCILVASASFWEGFDVPGDALQLLVIDKLPFPPPGDPLVEARTQKIEQAGGKAFKAYAMPEAAVALKQGAGRLIRRETDRGILVVGDTRLVTMGYGKQLLAALPPMRRLETEDDFQKALAALTRTSTTDPTCP